MLGNAIACRALMINCVCVATGTIPNIINQALSSPDWKFYKEAVDTELNMITDLDVFTDSRQLPAGKRR